MYDAWAAYDSTSVGYFHQEQITSTNPNEFRDEAISYAAYRILSDRFADSPGNSTSLPAFDAKMTALGYDSTITTANGTSAAAVGNRVAATILQYGLTDGSNEQNGYVDDGSGYAPVNPAMDVSMSGTL